MKFKIPGKVLLGVQKRDDTYNGLLGFLTCYTSKKETRIEREDIWNKWCEDDIPKITYENVPIDGFVVNKSVTHGGGRSERTWGTRQKYEKLRIHDPRGFEIEIQPKNMVLLLMYMSSEKGGSFSGKCVYAWLGVSLWILPVDSPEYKEIIEKREKKRVSNFNKKTMTVGGVYTFFNDSDDEYVYMGYHKVYGRQNYKIPGKNCHVYYNEKRRSYSFKHGYTYLDSMLASCSAEPIDYTVLETVWLSKPSILILLGKVLFTETYRPRGRMFFEHHEIIYSCYISSIRSHWTGERRSFSEESYHWAGGDSYMISINHKSGALDVEWVEQPPVSFHEVMSCKTPVYEDLGVELESKFLDKIEYFRPYDYSH